MSIVLKSEKEGYPVNESITLALRSSVSRSSCFRALDYFTSPVSNSTTLGPFFPWDDLGRDWETLSSFSSGRVERFYYTRCTRQSFLLLFFFLIIVTFWFFTIFGGIRQHRRNLFIFITILKKSFRYIDRILHFPLLAHIHQTYWHSKTVVPLFKFRQLYARRRIFSRRVKWHKSLEQFSVVPLFARHSFVRVFLSFFFFQSSTFSTLGALYSHGDFNLRTYTSLLPRFASVLRPSRNDIGCRTSASTPREINPVWSGVAGKIRRKNSRESWRNYVRPDTSGLGNSFWFFGPFGINGSGRVDAGKFVVPLDLCVCSPQAAVEVVAATAARDMCLMELSTSEGSWRGMRWKIYLRFNHMATMTALFDVEQCATLSTSTRGLNIHASRLLSCWPPPSPQTR